MIDIQTDQAGLVLNALPHAVIMVDAQGYIISANWGAENFLSASISHLTNRKLDEFIPFGSPLMILLEQVRERRGPVSEYRVDLSSPRLGDEKLVDIYASPVGNTDNVVVVFQERSRADKIDRQLTHRAAARSVSGLASMLAHEIKNPLSGIRGAAQLLEMSVSDEDKSLARLIRDETDRIVSLVDRMEVFSDERPIDRVATNIHSVLDHVKAIAKAGFARNIEIAELYDPSLPEVFANRDQLIQVFLNLIKNAAEAVKGQENPKITMITAFRPGIKISVGSTRERVSLPLEFSIQDNGPGVPADIQPHLFDPFITTKTNGSGLGLALVAKIVGAHGGIVECDSQKGRTTFKVLMPISRVENIAKNRDVETSLKLSNTHLDGA
ncbi:two-component system sensor histidine kinase NtrB [Lentilitoribacter sp. EG35]|uniref:two-component system sensor histidine kinase NtrB n=1 Tax=Lentilitoribacter sp. EG35 TaxID=3234192 RepID=UPI00346095BD